MKRLAAWLLFATVGLGLAATFAIAVNKRPALTADATSPAVQTAQPPMPAAQTSQTAEPVMAQDASLVRLEARAPLSGLASPGAPPAPPDPASLPKRWRLVHQPVATAAGVLEVNGMTLVLTGIDIVAANETCTAPSGQSWPCGMAARTAFRAYLRGRALNCHLPDKPVETGQLAECLLQGEDPSLWLITRGWARAKSDGPFALQEAIAEQSLKGIFGSPPR